MAYVHGHIRNGARRGGGTKMLPPDHLIQVRRRREDARADQAEKVEYFNQAARKTTWELKTDQKINNLKVQNKFKQMKAADDYELEQRRNRLANLLAREQREFEAEIEATFETPEQRVAAMKERARELRNKREDERRAFAEEQLQRKWRADCDALRHVESRAMQAQTNAEREEQLRIKAEQKKQEEEENARYAEMWELNRQEKIGREEADKARREALVKDQLRVLNDQVQLQKERQREALALKNEQRALLEEHWRLEAEAEARRARERQEAIRARRAELDRHNAQTRARKQAEMERERELDLRVIEEMMVAEEGEREQVAQQKAALRAEVEAYKQHLIQTREYERQQDQVMDRLRLAQQEQEWAKRQAQWDKETAARQRLMEEVYKERQAQIAHKLEKNREARFEKQKEAVRAQQEAERNAQLDQHEKRARMAQEKMQKLALAEQLEEKRAVRDAEADQAAREYQEFLRADEEYERLLKSELDRNVHLRGHGRQKINFQYT